MSHIWGAQNIVPRIIWVGKWYWFIFGELTREADAIQLEHEADEDEVSSMS